MCSRWNNKGGELTWACHWLIEAAERESLPVGPVEQEKETELRLLEFRLICQKCASIEINQCKPVCALCVL